MTNGPRANQEETPAARIAAAARVVVYKQWAEYRLPADYADIRQAIAAVVERELLLAELRGLSIEGKDRRDLRQREILGKLG